MKEVMTRIQRVEQMIERAYNCPNSLSAQQRYMRSALDMLVQIKEELVHIDIEHNQVKGHLEDMLRS